MLSLADLCTPLTPEQVKATIYNVLSRIGVSTTNWKPGAVVRTIIAFVAVLFSSFTYWSSRAVQGGFLLLARGDWLTACAKYDYGTDRNPATFATGPVTLTNTGAGVYDFDPGDLTLTYSKTGTDGATVLYYYQNTGTIHVSSGSPLASHQTITIEAELQGSAPSILPLATVNLQPSYTGLSITVDQGAISGSDEESDQSLINRSMDAASSISPNGPKDAYEYTALNVKDTNGAPLATKVSVVNGNPVLVYVGTDSGGVTGTMGDPATPLGAIHQAIQINVVPLGVTETTSTGTAKQISVIYTVWASKVTTLSSDDIKTYIATAIANYIATFPMGGFPVATVDGTHASGTSWMYLDAIKSTVEGALVGVQGIVNPIYHAEVSTTAWYGNDIQFNPGDVAVNVSSVDNGQVTLQ